MTLLDDAWLESAPRPRSRLRSLLLVLLVAGLVFLGGVEAQKRYGVAGGGLPAAGGAPAGLSGSGPPSGGFPGAGAAGTAPSGSPSAAASQAAQAAQSAVIGTLTEVRGDVWTVTDLGGTVHTITVSDGVVIAREKKLAADQVSTGATVDVEGSADASGDLTATTVTVR